MNRDELKSALTEMGVSYAGNASTEKLQALYDEAMARKAAGEWPSTPMDAAPEDAAPPEELPPGPEAAAAKESAAAATKEAAAAKKEAATLQPAEAPKDIPEAEISEKVTAGLTRDQAIEVITNQRAWDELQKKR